MCNGNGNSGWISRRCEVKSVSMPGASKIGDGRTGDIKVCPDEIANGGVGVPVFESQTDGNRCGMSDLIDGKNRRYFYDSSVIIRFNFSCI